MKTNVHDYQINNFKIASKKIIIAALLVVSVSAFAQDNTGKKNKSDRTSKEMRSPEEKVEARLKKMTTDLSLDANQQAQMKLFIVDQNNKSEALKAERAASKDAKPSKEDREAMRAKRDADKTASDARVKAILNPVQYDKYIAMEEANKAKMQDRMKERGGDRGGDRGGNNNGQE